MKSWFLHPLRVRYEETDQMKVVYHANYLTWFEIGRTEWVRRAGLPYQQMEERGLLLPVTHAEASFLRPARYDDWVTVCTHLEEMSSLRLHFQYRIVLGNLTDEYGSSLQEEEPPGTVLVTGETRHVWVNSDWKPIRLEKEAPDIHAILKDWVLASGGKA